MYELECFRVDADSTETYEFQFDMFKRIKKITKKISFAFSSEEFARIEYENNVKDKQSAQLDGKNIIYTIKDVDIEYKTLEETKSEYMDLLYTCGVVKK